MTPRILFLGEGSEAGPAAYLSAILRWSSLQWDHLVDEDPIPKEKFKQRYNLIILSDYRYASFTVGSESWLVQQVDEGAGLLMIGGWASFTGLVGHYKGSAVEKLLPVECVHGDDRVHRPGGAVLRPVGKPDLFQNLQWSQPPTVCGYHHVQVKKQTQTLLAFHDLDLSGAEPKWGTSHPALVVGWAGKGRTAAFLTDCAPHWAGGLVDWGERRIQVKWGRDRCVEVGEQYLLFFKQIMTSLIS
jgi:uncharacterized membrane protein